VGLGFFFREAHVLVWGVEFFCFLFFLAVGLSFSLLRVAIAVPVITIGVVTFLLSIGGFCFGSKLGNAFESKIHIVGGIVLIAIGVKILLEHLLI